MPFRADEHVRAKCFHPFGKFVEFPIEDVETSIAKRFESIVRMQPQRDAIKSGNHCLTYEALNQVANRVARAVLTMRGRGNEPVALVLEQGVTLIGAIFGVLKAGKIYVSLDPSHPPARMSYILEDTGAKLVITNSANFSHVSQIFRKGCQLLNIDGIDADTSVENAGLILTPETPAYIMYTSGSTGGPKGVVQSHRSLLHCIKNYTNGFHITADDRLTLLHSSSFHGSVYNLFGALLNGAALLAFDLKREGVNGLGEWLAREEVSILHTTPTAFSQAVQSFNGAEQFPRLRLIHLSAAPVTKREVELYKHHFSPGCIFVHRMGTTETGTIRWFFMDKATPVDGNRVPIGYPVDNQEVLLLNESGHDGEGEIAVKSRYLSLGYWRRPQLTQAKFLRDPQGGDDTIYLTGDLGRMAPDGCLFHLGRKDSQVKVRGYIVDVCEIETILLDHSGIKDVAVVGWEMESGDKLLAAYLVPIERSSPTVTELRDFLKGMLPDYMIPSAFVRLNALPLTPNGKLDRSALPTPENSRPEIDTPFAPPATAIEKELARIWTDILSLDRVGIYDNFFDLGGHSLLASQVASRIFEHFQLLIPLQLLFSCPTVAEMAKLITEHQGRQLGNEELQRILSELESLSDQEAARLAGEKQQEK